MKEYFLSAPIQAHNFEKEINLTCNSCSNFPRNPLCQSCIAEAYFQWLKGHQHIESEAKKVVKEFLKRNRHLENNSVKCVSCNRNSAHTCPYCFTEFLYGVTKESGAGVRSLTEFLYIFNFDLRRIGYSKELEAMGGY